MKTLILLIGLLSLNAYAGNEKGNGGDAIICRNVQGKITRSELLDYYEGRVYRQLGHHFDESLTHEEYFEKVSAKLLDFDPERFSTFKEDSINLLRSMQEYRLGLPQSSPGYVYTSGNLPDIPDSAHIVMPKDCAIEQFVIQAIQKYPEDPKFIIQSEILDSLNEDDFRGIILHEILYKVFIKSFNVTNSVTARYFHQVLTSVPLNDFLFMEYVTLMKEILPVVHLPRSKQSILRQDRHLYPESFEKVNEKYFKLDATGARYIYSRDGVIDAQKTIKTSHAFILFTSKVKEPKKCYPDDIEITVTDSKGKNEDWKAWRHWRPSWQEHRDVPFGKIKFELNIPANKDKKCRGGIVEVYYNDKVLLSYQLLTKAQALEFNFDLGLDEKLYPLMTALP